MKKVNLEEFSKAVIALQGLPTGLKIVLVPRKKGERWVRADTGVNVPIPTAKSLPYLDEKAKVSDLLAAVTNLLEVGLDLSAKVKLAKKKEVYPAHTSLKRIRAEEPATTVRKTGEIDTQKLAKEFASFLAAAERAFKPKDLATQAVLETCMEGLISRYARKTVAAAVNRV